MNLSNKDLSTLLWAAYGLRDDDTHTVSAINNDHAAVIYVLTEEAAYTYDAITHSLQVYKEGDHRSDIDILQYEAPIQLGLCWNTSIADPNQGGVELGQIGQNIQFMANALRLGTVVTGQIPAAIDPLGIPDDEEGMIIMPLGHPLNEYDFVNRPLWFSFLPKIKQSSMTITAALKLRSEETEITGSLSREQLSQMLWSAYGFSPYLDTSEQEPIHLKRHRTVPSAHGYYPLRMYAVTPDGVFQYIPNLFVELLIDVSAPVDRVGLPVVSLLWKMSDDDVRDELSDIVNDELISAAPLVIVPVIDLVRAKELSMQSARRFWYYEAGAVAHNVLLESTAWGLSSKLIYPVNEQGVRSVLGLPTNQIPQLLVTVGS